MRQALLAAIFTAITVPLYAQFLPDLQAKTPEEYDAWLDVLDGPVIERAALFARSFPQSALLLPAYELTAGEWRSRGEAALATTAVRRALAIAPDYPPMVTELADLLANNPQASDEAAAQARRALVLLSEARAPQRVGVEEWTTAIAALKAKAHGALGLVLFRRDDVAGAITEFEAALVQPGVHDPVLHYRLGRLYLSTGRRADGQKQLTEAMRRGDKVLRERSRAALAELR